MPPFPRAIKALFVITFVWCLIAAGCIAAAVIAAAQLRFPLAITLIIAGCTTFGLLVYARSLFMRATELFYAIIYMYYVAGNDLGLFAAIRLSINSAVSYLALKALFVPSLIMRTIARLFQKEGESMAFLFLSEEIYQLELYKLISTGKPGTLESIQADVNLLVPHIRVLMGFDKLMMRRTRSFVWILALGFFLLIAAAAFGVATVAFGAYVFVGMALTAVVSATFLNNELFTYRAKLYYGLLRDPRLLADVSAFDTALPRRQNLLLMVPLFFALMWGGALLATKFYTAGILIVAVCPLLLPSLIFSSEVRSMYVRLAFLRKMGFDIKVTSEMEQRELEHVEYLTRGIIAPGTTVTSAQTGPLFVWSAVLFGLGMIPFFSMLFCPIAVGILYIASKGRLSQAVENTSGVRVLQLLGVAGTLPVIGFPFALAGVIVSLVHRHRALQT